MVGGFEPEAVALATYDKLIADLLASADGGPAALTSAVEAAYDRLDMRFLERVRRRRRRRDQRRIRERSGAAGR